MKKSVLCAAFIIGLGATACGSGTSSDDSSAPTGANTNTSTNTTGTSTFGGSCTAVGSGGTVCTDRFKLTAGATQGMCQSTAYLTLTYSADHCPTSNLLGKCTLSSSGDVGYYYTDGAAQKTIYQNECAQGHGTWSDT